MFTACEPKSVNPVLPVEVWKTPLLVVNRVPWISPACTTLAATDLVPAATPKNECGPAVAVYSIVPGVVAAVCPISEIPVLVIPAVAAVPIKAVSAVEVAVLKNEFKVVNNADCTWPVFKTEFPIFDTPPTVP